MNFEASPLNREVQRILSAGPLPVSNRWTAVLNMTGNVNYTAIKVMSVDIVRDYVNDYSERLMVELAFGLGTWQHEILPNKMGLTITLKRELLEESSGAVNQNATTVTQPMRATVVDATSSTIEGSELYAESADAGNLVSIKVVRFQLTDLAVEQTRMQSAGGTLRKCTVEDAIKTLLSNMSQAIAVDQQHALIGVDVAKANNPQVYNNIVVPHAERLVDVPKYIYHHYGSPYSTGMGFFIQANTWWVYPLYDLSRYDTAEKSLTIINVPKNRYPMLDRTYRTTNSQVIVLSTADVKHMDVSENYQLNQGNGLRYADAAKLFNGFTKNEDNKSTALRAENNSELVAQGRPTGLNNIQRASSPVTSNPMRMLGEVSKGLGAIIMVTWENSQVGLIIPGMPMKYLYSVNGKVMEAKGIVLKTQTQYLPVTPGMLPSPYRSVTVISCFVSHLLDWSQSGEDATAPTDTTTT